MPEFMANWSIQHAAVEPNEIDVLQEVLNSFTDILEQVITSFNCLASHFHVVDRGRHRPRHGSLFPPILHPGRDHSIDQQLIYWHNQAFRLLPPIIILITRLTDEV